MSEIKYEKEIRGLVQEMYDVMLEDLQAEMTFDAFLEEVLEDVGTDMQGLSDQLQVGVDNGFPVETQLQIARSLMHR